MNAEQLAGLVRHILTVAGGGLVTAGVIDEAGLTLAAGAIATLIGIVWSVIAKKQKDA